MSKLKIFYSTFLSCPRCGGAISYRWFGAWLSGFGSLLPVVLIFGLAPMETLSLQYVLMILGLSLVLGHAIWALLFVYTVPLVAVPWRAPMALRGYVVLLLVASLVVVFSVIVEYFQRSH